MEFTEYLPHVNASLNLVATGLLLAGFVLVKRGKLKAHKIAMLSCFVVSCLFLVSYLTYHINEPSKKFPGEIYPIAKYPYYAILLTHVLLAATVPILAIASIWIAFAGRIEIHKKLVKWTFPIWLYVSVTGVLIYLMLYIWFIEK